MIVENIKNLKKQFKKDVTLVAVSKTIDIETIKIAVENGIDILGENKVQEAHEKFLEIQKFIQELEVKAKIYGNVKNLENYKNLKWHLIGHLQTNKVKKAIEFADLIHSVDSVSLLQSINKHSRQIGKTQNILIQVNTSGEESKFGMDEKSVVELFVLIVKHEDEYCSNVQILGLMTMAPLTDNETEIRECFGKAKVLFDRLKLDYFGYSFLDMKYLSMGMSHDFGLAIDEGANMVRIGSAIFGERKCF